MKSLYSLFFLLWFLPTFGQEPDQDTIQEGPIGMTVDQFNLRIKTTTKPLLVYLTADWCIVCKRQKPVLKQVFVETKGEAELLPIDMESNPLIAEYFEVDGLPALILYKDGYMIWDRVGFQDKETILEQIKVFLKKK